VREPSVLAAGPADAPGPALQRREVPAARCAVSALDGRRAMVTATTPDDCDVTRPLALGYVRAHILMTEYELAAAKQDLADFARREGYALGRVYVERIDQSPAAFQALMAEIHRREATAVVVPGPHHLTVVGSPRSLKDHLEHYTSARVLTARASP